MTVINTSNNFVQCKISETNCVATLGISYHVYTHIHIYIHTYIYTHTYIYMCVYMYTYIINYIDDWSSTDVIHIFRPPKGLWQSATSAIIFKLILKAYGIQGSAYKRIENFCLIKTRSYSLWGLFYLDWHYQWST